MPGKVWWKSKTVWLNLLAIASALGSGELGLPLPPGVAVVVVAVANVVVRILTDQPIRLTRPRSMS